MESAVQLPRYVVFDLSAGAGLRCFSAAPAMDHIGVPFHAQALGLEALRRARLSRAADLAAHRPVKPARTATNSCDRVQASDPDTVSDAGTSAVKVAEEESEDEADSSDELFLRESFARKIDALAQLVGMEMEDACKPAAVLGEVVRVLRGEGISWAIDRKECSERATTAV